MKSLLAVAPLIAAAAAAEPWINEVDTGLETYLFSTNYTKGTQPQLKDMRAIVDFDWSARQKLTNQQYSFYRVGAAGEWSYRNNLGIWSKVKFRPHQMTDVTKVNETLTTTVLGYNFSAPLMISPAARAGYGDPDRAEINFVDATYNENILYVAALYATMTIEEIGAARRDDQVIFQQIYTNMNKSVTWDNIARAEAAGAKAIVWTIDAPGDSTRHRAARYDTTNANSVTSEITWDVYEEMKTHTELPIILKGISTVEDALTAVEKGAKAIWISNHGGRQLEYSPSPLEIAYEIHRNAPQIFTQVDVLADSGVRYGTDVLKLLSLGVKMVGLGRPMMYANCYGLDGVTKAIQIMKTEIAHDAAQAGISDVHNIPARALNMRALENEVFVLDQ